MGPQPRLALRLRQQPLGGTGRRKRTTQDVHGRRATASSNNRPEPSIIRDLKLEALEDIDQFRAGDSVETAPSFEETKDNPHHHQSEVTSGNASYERTLFLVACHWDWSESSKPYGVYKVDLAHSRVTRKRLHRAGHVAAHGGGKSFTTVPHRAWIVGVGGDPTGGDTVIFDTKEKKVIQGPNLKSAKWLPILMPVGDKVYAMSWTPSYIRDPDFPPWFEVLDLSGAKVVTIDDRCHLVGCSWTALPHPPCLPWKMSPDDYTMLPIAVLMSYVVVNHYILISFQLDWGIHAFDTNSCEWHKVDDKNLPFKGCAAPLGPSIFLGLSAEDGPINAYCIRIATSDRGQDLKLFISVLPLKNKECEVTPGPCFLPLEGGRFCSLSFSIDRSSITLHPESRELYPKVAHVDLTTYQIENPSLLEDDADLQGLKKQEIEVSTQKEQAFKVSSTHGFLPSVYKLLSI